MPVVDQKLDCNMTGTDGWLHQAACRNPQTFGHGLEVVTDTIQANTPSPCPWSTPATPSSIATQAAPAPSGCRAVRWLGAAAGTRFDGVRRFREHAEWPRPSPS